MMRTSGRGRISGRGRVRRDETLPSRPEIRLHRLRVQEARKNGTDVIDLGYADVREQPPAVVIEEFQRRIAGEKAVHYYGEVGGILPLRTAIADYLSTDGTRINPNTVIVTAGANHAVVLALLATTVPEDLVVVPVPYFFNHITQIQLVGCKPLPLRTHPEEDYALPAADAWDRAFAEPQTAAVLLTQPRNPTATQIQDDEMTRVLSRAKERQRAVIIDESYGEFRREGDSPPRIASNEAIRVGSLSKSFCLAGWRIGYMVVPEMCVDDVLKAQDALMIHTAVASQHMALAALEHNRSTGYVTSLAQEIAQRRKLVKECLLKCDWVHNVFADAGTFVWIVLAHKGSAEKTTARLLSECGIGVLSGQAFDASGNDCLRMGVGCVSPARLQEALERLSRWEG